MKLQIAALVTAIALSSIAFAPVYAASAAPATSVAKSATKTATSSAMTAKPKMAKVKAADPQRFATAAAAQASCPTDTVVWANAKSKIFHLQGTATFGKGKNGTYMCQTAATSEKFVPTKKPEKQVAAK